MCPLRRALAMRRLLQRGLKVRAKAAMSARSGATAAANQACAVVKPVLRLAGKVVCMAATVPLLVRGIVLLT